MITHSENLEWASRSLDVLAWAGQLDATGRQYHETMKPLYTLAKSLSSKQPRESLQYPENDHVHFREILGTAPLHDATHRLAQLLYVPPKSELECGKGPSRYRPNLEETATSLDEVGLGVHLYWALEFEADETRTDAEEILRDTTSFSTAWSSSRGHFAGGVHPYGWVTSRSFVDPALTEVNTTNIFV